MPFDANRLKGYKAVNDLVDADTGRVVVEAGKKITVRQARQLSEKGLKHLRMTDDELIGHYIAEDLVNAKTGEIYVEAGEEITEKNLKMLIETGYKELPLLDIDHVNVGAYIRNTLAVDKNMTREDALFDIYRVMRPGEPPTLDTAQAMFNSLFFDSERYDLSAVGRVKMNMRLDLDAEDTVRILRKEDIIAVIRTLVDLRDGKGEIDDIDHLGNRRVRSVGELMENQYRIGLLRMERAIKERMSSVDIDTVMPQDLINAKPAAAAVREFFGSSQLSQFMDQTNPLSEITHKRRSVGARAGRAHARTRGLRGARRASDALRPHLPDRDAGRAEYRSDQFARDLCAGEQVRLRRDALSQSERRPRHRRRDLSLGDGGRPLHGGAGERGDRQPRQVHGRPDRVPACRRRADGAAREGRLHGRLAQAARVGCGGAHPVPGERRRQPRADGLEHAAPGGAAGARGSAVRRHRHGRRGRARFRRGHRRAPHRRGRSGRRHPYRRARDGGDPIRRSRASISTGCRSSSARTRAPASTSGRW